MGRAGSLCPVGHTAAGTSQRTPRVQRLTNSVRGQAYQQAAHPAPIHTVTSNLCFFLLNLFEPLLSKISSLGKTYSWNRGGVFWLEGQAALSPPLAWPGLAQCPLLTSTQRQAGHSLGGTPPGWESQHHCLCRVFPLCCYFLWLCHLEPNELTGQA